MPHPAGGTIWDKLNAHGISWLDYACDLPDIILFPKTFGANLDKIKHVPRSSSPTAQRARCRRSRS